MSIKRRTPAGWQILAGSTWTATPDVVPALYTVNEGIRDQHFEADGRMWESEHWVLDYHFFAGERYHVENSDWQIRETGAWHLYPPMTPWWQDTHNCKLPLHNIWMRFTGGDRVGLLRLMPSSGPRLTRFRDPKGILLKRVQLMAQQAEALGESGFIPAMSGLMDTINLLLTAHPVSTGLYEINTSPTLSVSDPLVTNIKRHLSDIFRGRVTREAVAKHVHASVATIERHYHDAMGETIHRTVHRMRLLEAKQILVDGGSLKEAAERTGFCDAFHLSKSFKQHEGLSPREFLRRMKK